MPLNKEPLIEVSMLLHRSTKGWGSATLCTRPPSCTSLSQRFPSPVVHRNEMAMFSLTTQWTKSAEPSLAVLRTSRDSSTSELANFPQQKPSRGQNLIRALVDLFTSGGRGGRSRAAASKNYLYISVQV